MKSPKTSSSVPPFSRTLDQSQKPDVFPCQSLPTSTNPTFFKPPAVACTNFEPSPPEIDEKGFQIVKSTEEASSFAGCLKPRYGKDAVGFYKGKKENSRSIPQPSLPPEESWFLLSFTSETTERLTVARDSSTNTSRAPCLPLSCPPDQESRRVANGCNHAQDNSRAWTDIVKG